MGNVLRTDGSTDLFFKIKMFLKGKTASDLDRVGEVRPGARAKSGIENLFYYGGVFFVLCALLVVNVVFYKRLSMKEISSICFSKNIFNRVMPLSPFFLAKWEDSPGHKIDLFTPLNLFSDKNGRWILRGQRKGERAGCFGVELVEVKRKPYQLQLVGYAYIREGDSPSLFLLDTDTQGIIQVKVGDLLQGYDVQVVAFNSPSGGKNPSTELRDMQFGKSVQLVLNQNASEWRYEAIFMNKETGEQFTMNPLAAQLRIGNDQIWLRELDYENQTATLERYSPNNDSTQIRILNITSGREG